MHFITALQKGEFPKLIRALKIDSIIIGFCIGLIVIGVIGSFFIKPQLAHIRTAIASIEDPMEREQAFQDAMKKFWEERLVLFTTFAFFSAIFHLSLPAYFFIRNKTLFPKKWVPITSCLLIYLFQLQGILCVFCLFAYSYKEYFLPFQEHRKKAA